MTFEQFIESHRGKRVVVCGLGVSNMPLIRLLRKNGIDIEARDRAGAGELAAADELKELGCTLITGENYLEGIEADIVYRSPGIHPGKLSEAVKSGARLTSEIEAFFEVCPCTTIGITGSDGKTTTSTIIARLLEQAGKTVWLGGNIGTPLLDRVPDMRETDFAVLELSSFQLMTMTHCPDIAVVTNVSPNHLDIHSSMDEYIEAKRNIFRDGKPQKVVLNYDNEITREFGADIDKPVWFSRREKPETGMWLADDCIKACKANMLDADTDKSAIINIDEIRIPAGNERKIVNIDEIKIPGFHNVENYMAAFCAVDGIVSVDDMRAVARTFTGVEHRIEFVRECKGVKYYNNSIGTSPTRTVAALEAFPDKVILIAGGYDKQIPFTPLAEALEAHVKKLVLVGATSGLIREAAELCGYTDIYDAASFREAVEIARDSAESGDIVLLSPACAAFDLFKNFAERGNVFKDIVNGFEA